MAFWVGLFATYALVGYVVRGYGTGIAASLTVLTGCLIVGMARRHARAPKDEDTRDGCKGLNEH